jgi:hypothetical protein
MDADAATDIQIASPIFDWRNPEYPAVFRRRAESLKRIRTATRGQIKSLKGFYRENPIIFINDWGCTYDPRNPERGLPSTIPFLLFPRQIEWLQWVLDHWEQQKPGISEKSRDMGLSWLSVALADTLCMFRNDLAIGFGSRKEDYVDKIGFPKSLFYKARMFIKMCPVEFREGWQERRHAPHMRISFPWTGSVMTGEAGDNIGRGDRQSIFFTDEEAYLERPMLVEHALSQTTNCRISISSANGMANPFAQKRHAGKIDVFTFRWQDDPRKDDAWYQKQVDELDPITVAQEIDINYAASTEGVLIPSAWINAAFDAHIKLGIKPTGERWAALDVADEGRDLNAFCGMHGILVEEIEEWSGKGGDIYRTTERAFGLCDIGGYRRLKYDADGLGSGCRGDARILNEVRKKKGQAQLTVEAFRGSEAVSNPLSEDVPGRTNEDFFANCKAQSWWQLRTKFRTTYRALVDKLPYNPDEIISISSAIKKKNKIINELSQITYTKNDAGKILIDKAPDGVLSPNLADSVNIASANSTRRRMSISEAAIEEA